MKLKPIKFLVYFLLKAIIYAGLIYFSNIHDTIKGVLFNATFFGLLMALF
jgi:hypothetical protein